MNAQAVFIFDLLLPTMKKIRLTFIPLLLPLWVLMTAIPAMPAYAQAAQAADLTLLAAQSRGDTTEALPVAFMNRPIFTLRAKLEGYTQE